MSDLMLPADPFAQWLHSHIRRFGRATERTRLQLGGGEFRAIEALIPGDTVPIKTVDRCLTRMDSGDNLWTLYPDLDTQHAGRVDRGRSYVCDEQLLITAHRMHMDGMSVRAVARELFDDCYSASPHALAMGLLSAWRGRGWEIRSRSDATALSNVQRGWRPRCSHIHKIGEHRGQRCERRCVGNDETCWKHDPERIAAGLARVRSIA
jgi:hypothetical protein